VLLAQVVGVRLGVGGQGADDGRLIGVHVGQGRYSSPSARRARATTRGRGGRCSSVTALADNHVVDATATNAKAGLGSPSWQLQAVDGSETGMGEAPADR
jgi:hypothetical protein